MPRQLRQLVTFRLPSDLVQWLANHVEDGKRTELVEDLLTAKRDRRLTILDTPLPPSPSLATDMIEPLLVALRERRVLITSEPAPYESNHGDCGDCPVFVCLNPPVKRKR